MKTGVNYVIFVTLCMFFSMSIGNNISDWHDVAFVFLIVILIFYIYKILKAKYTGISVDTAEFFIKKMVKEKSEICLILRPFGRDGFVSISNLRSGNVWQSIFRNWIEGVTMEQVIDKQVKKILEVRSVALVNPELKFIPDSPTYIRTDNKTWKWAIFDLLKYSKVVFIIIPPGEDVRGSLKWEVSKAIQLGLIDRIIFIIPPMSLKNKMKVLDSMKKKLSFISDDFLKLPLDTIAIQIRYNQDLLYYVVDETKEVDKREKSDIAGINYSNLIAHILSEIDEKLKATTFKSRCKFIEKKYDELDYELTKENLSILMNNITID